MINHALDSIADWLRPHIEAHPAAHNLLRQLVLGAAAAMLIGAVAAIAYDMMGPWPYDNWKANTQQQDQATQHP